MPHNATSLNQPSSEQVIAIEQLAAGSTVVRAAQIAGVSRETIHRWCRDDWEFQAALNRARRDLQEAVHRRLLAAAERAAANVAEAVEGGNLSASLALLKSLGSMGITSRDLGSDDPEILAEEAELREREAKTARVWRSVHADF